MPLTCSILAYKLLDSSDSSKTNCNGIIARVCHLQEHGQQRPTSLYLCKEQPGVTFFCCWRYEACSEPG